MASVESQVMACAAPCSTVETRIHSFDEWPRIAPVWARLFESSHRFSFFLSPEWVDTWMSVFGESLRPSILLFEGEGEIQGACLLVESRLRYGPLAVRRVSLNTTGEQAGEATYPEFNQVLCREGWEGAVWDALAGYVSRRKWDQLTLDGFLAEESYRAIADRFGDLKKVEERRPSPYVDLAAIRHAKATYESALASNTRWQVRRKTKDYLQYGELEIREAETVREAWGMFERLAEFGRIRWNSRGQPTPFTSARFLAFHRALIARCLGAGSVRLVRVTAGQLTVGIVYALVHRGKVYCYQCGFPLPAERKLSPGTVALAAVIRHFLAAGMNEFDFLAGEERYKKCLGTSSRLLVWTVLQRRTPKTVLLDGLRQLRRSAKQIWGRRRRGSSGAPERGEGMAEA